jgi:hypothetical protein
MKTETFAHVLAVHARLAFAVIMIGVCVLGAQAQEPAGGGGRTVWNGVYTDAQATRGQTQYEATCRSCHRDGPRREVAFMRDWQGLELEGLFNQTKATMPANAPSSLSDAAYLDIVAFMLRANMFPAGSSELTADTIRGVRVEGKNGPEPVPNFTLVHVVGCLMQGTEDAWVVARGTEPVRTKDPDPSKDAELKSSQATALGSQTFQLLNVYPRPDAYKGHKIEAKGFLIRNPAGDRLNATSVQSLAPSCGQ